MSTYFATSISVLSQIAVKAYDNSNAFKSNKGFSTPLGSVNLLSSQEVTPQLPNGFTLIAQGYDSKTNYYGIAMRNNATGEVVFAHRGTEGNVKDIQMDQAIANSKVPDSATAALNFVQKTIKENHLENSTIINVGHSKGAYEANYVNAKLSDSVMAGGDRSKFAAFGLDTPALDPVAAKLTQAVGSYQSLNIVATTDPVNQLTRAYGLVVPGQTVYVKVPGTGAADDITGMGEGCRKTAAALSASSSNLYVEGLAWGVAKLYDGDPRFPGSNTTTIGRLFAACNLDVTGHSSVALSNQLCKTISGMTLSGGMSDPTLRGNASNTVIGDVGWGTTEFRELAKRMINVYIGKGHGFGNAEGQINQQAIEATVSQAFAGVDMTGAKAFDMDGMLYVRLPSGKTLWVTPEGKLGSEQIQTRADGSTTIETHQTDGTVRQATLDAKGNYSAITTDAQGRLLGKVTAMIDGTRQVDINNPDTGERYTAKTTATGSTMTGVDASGKAVSASSSTRWDEVQGMYVTTSQNIDGSQTLAYSNKDGLLLQSTNSVKNADQTVTQTTTMNDGRGETLNYSASGQFLGGEVRYTNGFGVDVTERYGADKKLLSRTEVQTYDDGSRFEYKTEGGKNYIQAIDEDGKVSGWKEYKTPAQEQATNAMYSDMAGFVNALRGKDKVNQLLYAAKIGINYQISQGNTQLALGAQVIKGLVSCANDNSWRKTA